MIQYKVMDILDEQVYFHDNTGTIYSYCLYRIADTDKFQYFSLSDQDFITEKSWRYGFYTAKTRTDDKVIVTLMRERYLPIFAILFAVSVILSVFMSLRVVHFDGLTVSGAFLFFPLVFACTDIINELYGYNRVKGIIYATSGCMLVMAALMMLNFQFSGSLYGESDQPFLNLHKNIPFFLVSWAISLLIADSINAYVFHKIKYIMCRKALWLRSMTSTFLSQIIFSPINVTLLYYFNLREKTFFEEWSFHTSTQAIRFLYAFAVIPFIYAVVYYIRRKDASVERKDVKAYVHAV